MKKDHFSCEYTNDLLKKETVDKWLAAFSVGIDKDIFNHHVLESCNHMWHVFSWGEYPHLDGDAARNAFDSLDYTEALIFIGGYSQNDYPTIIKLGQTHKLSAKALDDIDDVYIVDCDFKWTYVHTHEEFCGPYFAVAK